MQNNKPNGPRITVERISVTTIRSRNRSQKVYCDNCKAEIMAGDLDGKQLLASGTQELTAVDSIEVFQANND